MNPREWSLVAFTLLMQTSVGVLVVAAALQPILSRGSLHAPGRPSDLPLLVAAITAVLAMVASLFHLGQPMQAWLALTNVRTSWLSREIVLATSFTVATVVLAALSRRATPAPALQGGVLAFAIVCGLAGVFAMARLYMVPAQPAWDRVATPAGFFASMFVLGAIVTLTCAVLRAPGDGPSLADAASARWLMLAAIVILGIQLLLLPAHLSAFAREPAPAISVGSAAAWAPWLAGARAAAAVAAIALLAAAMRALPATSPAAAIGVTALVFASEALGRVLFYAGSARLGPV